jgi:hypothetical protein
MVIVQKQKLQHGSQSKVLEALVLLSFKSFKL